MNFNLFATVLTFPAPTSNYRGDSEENRTVIQKITQGNKDYPVISPESMRNALREQLQNAGLPCNRSRLHNEDQLAVEFKEFPNGTKYADDFLFGFMVADPKAAKENSKLPAKRDSVLRMNLAVGTSPYRYNAMFNQSPLNAGKSTWKNSSKSALLHREVAHTAFQFPFALCGSDCKAGKPEWTKQLIRSIGELSNVAGGHARSFYEMAPASIIVRLTPSLVAGFDTYGFDEKGDFRDLARINKDDLPPEEFWIGGEIVRKMSQEDAEMLHGAHLFPNPQKLLAEVADAFLN
jgi:CRISPR-associated protein Cst2